jgi:hypothetical protein
MFTEISLRPWRNRASFTSTSSIRYRLEIEPLEERQLLAIGAQIFLTAPALTALRQQAVANTPLWSAFKAKLDAGLADVPGSAYEGSELQAISNYALGYQILQTIDPVTAANYADKTIAFMKSALFDYQRDGSITRQFLTRGNGITTTFTLPNADLIPSSLMVYLAPATTRAVVHGATNGQDAIGNFQKVIKVSNTSDGNPDYLEGVDWFRNSNLPETLIDWSLAGKEPTSGSTYYVTSTSGMFALPTTFTLSGHAITLAAAPTTNQAVFVEYVYGTRAPNYSTLAYQMTSAGGGGFNSIFIDNTYTSRNLGKNLAMGLDWLDGYPGFSATLKSQIITMLIRWSNYVRDYGYQHDNPGENYGAGGYVSRVMTALALLHRDPAGPGLLSDVLNYRQTHVIPSLTNASPSLRGGYYDEGWSYGQGAAQNLLLSGLALELAQQIPAASAERQWASEAIRSLISAQPTSSTMYDGGDWYTYPSYLPDNRLFDVLASMANDPTAQSYANHIIQTRPNRTRNDYLDLLFQNPSAPASFWGSFPLQYYADGTGLITARADWSYQSTWLAFQLGNILPAGHQSYAPGQLQIQRSGDDLLINANAIGGNQNFSTKSSFSNLIAINDNGAGLQNYAWNMGAWYGTPGVFITNYEAAANYLYFGGDYRAAYSTQDNPGGGGPATQLTRQVVYLRPDFVIVHDRAGTALSTFPKELRWHFLKAPTVVGNSWEETVGSSNLFGETFSAVPLTTTSYSVVDSGATIYRVATNNANPALNVQYTTALETAPSSVTSMVATQQVASTDGSMEGVLMGTYLVLFGKSGLLSPSAGPITYNINSSGSVSDLLTDLQPNAPYRIQVNGGSATTLTSSAQGTLSFTTPHGANTITVTGNSASNPVPAVSSLGQTSAPEGASSFALTVNGTGFVSTSAVRWNGTPLATTFVSSTQLAAAVPAANLAQEGTANIVVVNPTPGGGTSGTVSFSVNDAGLTGTGGVVSATEGVSFSGQVSTFTDANPLAPLSDFMSGSGGATIAWGDGTTSAGAVAQPGGIGTSFVVTGGHTYLTVGSYTMKVIITDTGGSKVTVTALASSIVKAGIVGRDLHSGQWYTGISNGTSFNTSVWGTWNSTVTWVDVRTGDFNGDGKTDIVGRDARTGQWWVALSNGSNAFSTAVWGAWNPAVTWVDVQVADFTAGGKSDIIGRVAGTGQWWVGLSTGSSFTTTLWTNWYSGVSWVDTQVGDFTGDGKSDIASRALESGQWWVGLSTGSSFSTALWASWYSGVTWVDVKVGDFNGDGKGDITGRVLQTGDWWTAVSTGTSFITSLWSTWSPTVTWVDVRVGNFNGDGKSDIIGRVLQSGDWWVGQSNGAGFIDSWWGNWNPADTWVDVQVGDFNGDGKDDISARNSQTGAWWTGLSTGTSFSSRVWAIWAPTITWVDVQKGVFI